MNIASEFAGCSLDDVKAMLDGGTLTVYSVARPITADRAVDRSGILATFTRLFRRPSAAGLCHADDPLNADDRGKPI